MQFTQLFLVNIVRSLSHQTACTLCFRESNNVTDRITFSHNHDQTVKTKGQTAVRRRTIFKSCLLYTSYLARMLEGGEDVRFIARRIVICAAEDVGNADPQALVVANAAAQAAHFVGLPEAQIPLAQAVCYIANAPKSNSCYMGIFNARQEVRSINTRVPKHLRDAHYPGAKQFGHGLGYKYPHDYPCLLYTSRCV